MSIVRKICSVLGCVALAVLLLACGLFPCIAPPTTRILSGAFSVQNAATSFSHDDMVNVADATRAYSFGNHDKTALLQAIYDANVNAAAARSAAGLAPAANAPKLTGVERTDTAAIEAAFERASDTYVYDADMISHLDDCYALELAGFAAIAVVLVICVACFVVCGKTGGVKTTRRMLRVAGIAVLALFVVCGIWAAIDFYSLFRVFHQVFFAQTGNWTFSETSLLICALPEDFWAGMGAVWLATSVIASILSILIGTLIGRRARRRNDSTPPRPPMRPQPFKEEL